MRNYVTYKTAVVHDLASMLFTAAAILSVSDVNQNPLTAPEISGMLPEGYENWIIVAVATANNAATADTLSKSDPQYFWDNRILATPVVLRESHSSVVDI